jgi:hypothetical protein
MSVFTVVTNGYDAGTGYYMDDELYTFVHCNDEHEKEDILLGVIENGGVDKVVRLDVDDLIDAMEEKHADDDDYYYFEYPDKLSELKKMMEEMS